MKRVRVAVNQLASGFFGQPGFFADSFAVAASQPAL
jgi:hypothetical protein